MVRPLKITFGKYKGQPASNASDSYCEWCVLNNVGGRKLQDYFKSRINYPKNEYMVEVEDSINEMDGKHHGIMAWSEDHAVRIIRRKTKCSQWPGTSFGARLVKDNSDQYVKRKPKTYESTWAIQNGY